MTQLVTRLTSPFRDSPTFGRDRATLMSGLTIGMAGLILNAAILLTFAPLMADPNDPDFREITQNVEFGQLLSLILLGGATVLATILIPLRMISVLWGPRIGGYFDQIVLSGISPFRFLIGKVTSQNLFLALILFLLLPYFVLCLTLGGIAPVFFLCGLLLVWLHCMMIALLTLWAALYMNELIAAMIVGFATCWMGGLGLIPIPVPVFVFTPMPALIYPLFQHIPNLQGSIPTDYLTVFFSCLAGMSCLSLLALGGIYLGPLYGIVRDNSTFGEVVRPGDSKRKRWFRLRYHIQRPSEIAFFYENRSDRFRNWEGLLRWGAGLTAVIGIAALAYGIFGYFVLNFLVANINRNSDWWVYELHATNLIFLGFGLAIAVILFSHARNTMYQRIRFGFGKTASITTLNLSSLALSFSLLVGTALVLPWLLHTEVTQPAGHDLFDFSESYGQYRPVNFHRVWLEGVAILLICGVTVSVIHHMFCQTIWVKAAAVLSTAGFYGVGIVLLPMVVTFSFYNTPEIRQYPQLHDLLPTIMTVSPAAVFGFLFNELGRNGPQNLSTTPFYVSHFVIMVLLLLRIRYVRRQVKATYLSGPQVEPAT